MTAFLISRAVAWSESDTIYEGRLPLRRVREAGASAQGETCPRSCVHAALALFAVRAKAAFRILGSSVAPSARELVVALVLPSLQACVIDKSYIVGAGFEPQLVPLGRE